MEKNRTERLNGAKIRITSGIAWILAVVLAVFWTLVTIIPFLFMVLNSFKGKFEMLSKGVFQLPEKLDLSNYITAVQGNFFFYFLHSIIVLAISLGLLLLISSCAAYPLSRFTFKLRGPIFSLIIASMSIPIHITLIPVFKMTKTMGMYDSIWALIGPYTAFAIPISVFILTGFMQKIPKEIEEAAAVDGCNKYRMFFTVILPLSKPGLSTLAIYNGVGMWNEFSFAYTLTQSPSARTLPLAVWDYQGQYAMNTPMILTVLTLTVLPMIILYIIMQDKLVKGMTAGAVKG